MTPTWGNLTEHIEEEDGRVILKRLVVQEELGQITQVLTVDDLLCSVDLKHTDRHIQLVRPVYLIAGRVSKFALSGVPVQLNTMAKEGEAELAKVQRLALVVLFRNRRKVPSGHFVFPEDD